RRLLLGVTVLQTLDDGVDVQRLAALAGVAAQVVTERVAQLALLGRGVLRDGLARGQGQGRHCDRNQTQLHSVEPPVMTRSGDTAPVCLDARDAPSGRTDPDGRARITAAALNRH